MTLKRRTYLHPPIIRVLHWVHVMAIIPAIILGFYITYPLATPWTLLELERMLFWSLVFVYATFVARIYLAIVWGDWRDLLINRQDLSHLPGFLSFVFFRRPVHPAYPQKYNPGQKLLFTTWFAILLGLLVTGFMLYYPAETTYLARPLGGLPSVRLYHYLLSLALAATVPVHIYLALTEDLGKLLAMFTGFVEKDYSPSRKFKVKRPRS